MLCLAGRSSEEGGQVTGRGCVARGLGLEGHGSARRVPGDAAPHLPRAPSRCRVCNGTESSVVPAVRSCVGTLVLPECPEEQPRVTPSGSSRPALTLARCVLCPGIMSVVAVPAGRSRAVLCSAGPPLPAVRVQKFSISGSVLLHCNGYTK